MIILSGILSSTSLLAKSETGYALGADISYVVIGDKFDGFVAGLESTYYINEFMMTADFTHYSEWALFTGPAEKVNQLSLLFGRQVGTDKFQIQGQGGYGLIWGVNRTDEILEHQFIGNVYATENFFTTGLALRLGFKYRPVENLSVGIDIKSNINEVETTFFPVISVDFLRLGKRKHKNEVTYTKL